MQHSLHINMYIKLQIVIFLYLINNYYSRNKYMSMPKKKKKKIKSYFVKNENKKYN